ncbi:dentin matrix acidic phosphoprotein 1 isoform X2 [Hoplias malabaricus]|uniref:dentin matrix acidic phosphoprotein 1 isoform X2 n=1 Tax=Hoplias malabaricus TaxID=27720 RepID=UPI0034632295
MEQNIAELLKDAVSEADIDFELDECSSMLQTQLVDDNDLKNVCKLWTSSDEGLAETFTNVYEQEEDEDSTESNEESASNYSPDAEAGCSSQRVDYDQVADEMIIEVQQGNEASNESSAEEECMQIKQETDVPFHGLVADASILGEEKHQNQELPLKSAEFQITSKADFQQLMEGTSSTLEPSETPEERESESEEEEPDTYATEETFQCDSAGNVDDSFIVIKPKIPIRDYDEDDLREFTEEDQDQTEESLADYPSDFSQSETEECEESAVNEDQMSIFKDNGLSNYCSSAKMEDLSHTEDHLLEEGRQTVSSSMDSDTEIKEPEVQVIPEEIDTGFQRNNVVEDDFQEPLTTDSNTEEDVCNQGIGNESCARNGNDPDQDYDSDINSDHSTSQEEISEASVEPEEDLKTDEQNNNTVDELGRVDEDVDYIGIDEEDRDGSDQEMDKDTNASCVSDIDYLYEEPHKQSPELCPTLESVKLDAATKEQDLFPSKPLDSVRDTNTLIPELFWYSDILKSECNLLLDEYDWDLTAEKLADKEGTQEDTQEDQDELDGDENGEEKERDWEQEKRRIEAFNRFYGDQVEIEEKADRNHKVTFCLKNESSECEEESDSEQELDNEFGKHATTLKAEYHSESDDERQEKFFIPDKTKVQPKEQPHVSPSQNEKPPRNKCLAVLKSILALGVVTVIGMVSFWWATDNLDWIH